MSITDRAAIFLAGVGVGLGAAMLWAPSSGDETRRRIKKSAAEAADRVNDSAAEIMAQGKQKWEDLQGDLKDKFRRTIDETAGASREVAHTAGKKMEETGKRLQEA